MMLSDVCLSDVCRVHLVLAGGRVPQQPPPLIPDVRDQYARAACAVGRLDGAYWLIVPVSAGLAQGCRCGLPLQAWAGAYRGGRPLTACLLINSANT